MLRLGPETFNFTMTLDLLHAVVDGRALNETEAETAMRGLLGGASSQVLTAAFLTALRMRGETADELAGFARAMRAAATPLPLEAAYRPVIDTCGTGGNKTAGFNISTIAAFVAAGAGVRVAKHGNRSITSKSGSADLLEALGVGTNVTPEVVAQSIREAGIGFLFAPAFHTATRHVQPVRLELKFRTAFNYLGPLTNPAGAEMQVVGTWSDEAAEKIAGALARLGLGRGFVLHGSDGMGEATLTAHTTVFAIREGAIEKRTITPEDFGLRRAEAEKLRGGDAEHNRAIAESVLAGETGPRRDIVVMNAALAIVAAGKAPDFREATEMAAESIDTGRARATLAALRRVTKMGRG
jgi:anthranilate phosphoribosyltransferase